MSKKRLYPAHLYDRTRRQIAVEITRKELDKQFPGSSHDSKAWLETKDDHGFWNSVEGVFGGMVLKPIVGLLTAENYSWSKQEVKVADLRLGSKLEQLNRLPSLDPIELDLKVIEKLVNADEKELTEQRRIVESYSQNENQNAYPILVREKDDKLIVLDGNRRALRALLNGTDTLEAWFCQTNNELALNFWVPIDEMMRLVALYDHGKTTNPELKDHVRATLNEMFKQSEVARIAFTNRIVGYSRGADELID